MRFAPITIALLFTLTLVIATPPDQAQPSDPADQLPPIPGIDAYALSMRKLKRPDKEFPPMVNRSALYEYSHHAARFARDAQTRQDVSRNPAISDSIRDRLTTTAEESNALKDEFYESAKQAARVHVPDPPNVPDYDNPTDYQAAGRYYHNAAQGLHSSAMEDKIESDKHYRMRPTGLAPTAENMRFAAIRSTLSQKKLALSREQLEKANDAHEALKSESRGGQASHAGDKRRSRSRSPENPAKKAKYGPESL
jgi:hypothetical protein